MNRLPFCAVRLVSIVTYLSGFVKCLFERAVAHSIFVRCIDKKLLREYNYSSEYDTKRLINRDLKR